MVVRLSALAVVLCVLATGCGDGSKRRDAVSDYITQVNVIEAQLSPPLRAITKANRDFARQRGDEADVLTRLRRADRSVRALHRRLVALPAPREARRLRGLLLELGTREQSLVREVEMLVVFLPKFDKILVPLTSAGAELKQALAAKVKLHTKITALDSYSARLEDVVARLRPLTPPPSSRRVWPQQIDTLERVRASAQALPDALRAGRAEAIPKRLRAFDLAALSNQSIEAQRTRIAAVVAYNNRIKRLNTLAAGIAREENRLRASLE